MDDLLSIIIILFYISFIYIFTLSIYNGIKNGVPLISSFNSDFIVMKRYLGKYKLKGKKLIDLGSGTGKATRFFKKTFQTKTYGIEIDLGSYFLSKVLNSITKSKIKISRGDYLKADLKKYDFIYIYLFPSIIGKIEEKIWKDAKSGTIIISNAFKFKKHSPIDILKDENGKEEVYIYKV